MLDKIEIILYSTTYVASDVFTLVFIHRLSEVVR